MMKYRKDFFYLFLLLGLGIIFWGEALAPGQVFFLRDISSEFVAKRHFWASSSGLTLWSPYSVFGIPYAANPQSEVFYPFNFFFSVFGAERGLVYYLVFHHLFFLLTFYLALRRVGFSAEGSLIGSTGFGFGGYLISFTHIPLFFSTVVWLGLLIICLQEAREDRWLSSSLWLALVIAVQILGGAIEAALMSWGLALGVVALAPGKGWERRGLIRLAGALAVGLLGGMILALPQIALAGELLPLSNRGEGMNFSDVFAWSLPLSGLRGLVVPNYLLPLSAGKYWGLGFFGGFSFLWSYYLGVTLLPLAAFSWAGYGQARGRALFWLGLALFGLVMMTGGNLGVYPWLYKYFPGFKLFRIPTKFFFLPNFCFVLLAVHGYECLSGRESRRFSSPASTICLLAGTALGLLLLVYPLRMGEGGDNYSAVTGYLFWRSVLRVSVFFLFMLGLVWSGLRFRRFFGGVGFALLIFGDLFFAHYRLNLSTGMNFYQPNSFIRDFLAAEKGRIPPPRVFSVTPRKEDLILQRVMDPEVSFKDFQNCLESGWATYFGINNIRGPGSFYPADVGKFKNILAEAKNPRNNLILARAGVEYLYRRDWGFEPLAGAFPRAMVFYEARGLADQDQAISLWSSPDFPAERVLLVEAGAGKVRPASGETRAESARIVEYRNERVAVEAEAREEAWLLLLDSYYPGWRAEVDGRPAEIVRADGFFRAVRIPAGRHRVVFGYFPAVFRDSLWVSGIGFIAWLALMIFGGIRPRKRESAT